MEHPEGTGCPLQYGRSFDFVREGMGDFQREKNPEIFRWAPKRIVLVWVLPRVYCLGGKSRVAEGHELPTGVPKDAPPPEIF